MQTVLDFTASLSAPQKLVWIVGVMAVFWLLEGYYSFAKLEYKKWRHARTNLALLGFVMLINIAFGLVTAGVFIWLSEGQIGLLHLIDLPVWLALLLSVLVLDLIAQYGAHYALHKVPALWRLHLVHHSDTHVDVTTGTRHHPLDFIFRESAALLAIVVMGMPLAYYLFYRVITIFFTYWTHANVRLSPKLDAVIGAVFVTPGMHKVHHHHTLPHTDMNFGNMFSIWDRLFGTYGTIAERQLVYGVDTADPAKSNDLGYQLAIPWDKTVGKATTDMQGNPVQ